MELDQAATAEFGKSTLADYCDRLPPTLRMVSEIVSCVEWYLELYVEVTDRANLQGRLPGFCCGRLLEVYNDNDMLEVCNGGQTLAEYRSQFAT